MFGAVGLNVKTKRSNLATRQLLGQTANDNCYHLALRVGFVSVEYHQTL